MTPAQAQAVIAKMRAKANAPMPTRDPSDGDAQDEANRIRYRARSGVWDLAADMLTEALAKSKATPADDGRKTIRVPAATLANWSSPISDPRPIAEAGPGLWRVIGIDYGTTGAAYDLDVVPALPPRSPSLE